MLTPLVAAVALLTRVPIRRTFDTADLARATAFYPLVGAALGCTQAALLLAAGAVFPVDGVDAGLSASIAAVCLVTVALWLTRALHLDGLADTADGFGGGRAPDEVLAIMRDPRVGTFGASAIVLMLVLRIACLTTAIERQAAIVPLIAAPAVGRWAMAATAAWLPYARPDGFGAVARGPRVGPALLGASVSACVLLGTLAHWRALPICLAAAGVLLLMGRSSRRRIGGYTGDTLGATGELTESAVWLSFLAAPA